MVSEPRSVRRLREFANRYPEYQEFTKLAIDLVSIRNDRAAAIAAVALLEGTLTTYLAFKFILHENEGKNDLFGAGAPLRAFSAKIKIGFGLGLYGPLTRDDLHNIREVRNSFAHAMVPITFDDEEVINVCRRVSLLTRIEEPFVTEFQELDVRNQFLSTVELLCIEFYVSPLRARSLFPNIRRAMDS